LINELIRLCGCQHQVESSQKQTLFIKWVIRENYYWKWDTETNGLKNEVDISTLKRY
jgi:hypothetical protein